MCVCLCERTHETVSLCVSHALQEAPMKPSVFLMTSKREASCRGKIKPTSIQNAESRDSLKSLKQR